MNRLAVTQWPDDPSSPVATCDTSAGCGGSFHVVAILDGVRCGRDRCPHCNELRRIPDSLHPLYLDHFGIVTRAIGRATRAGMPADVAETTCHTAYIEALHRWIPDRGTFPTFAYGRVNAAVVVELRHTRARPSVARLRGERERDDSPAAPEPPEPPHPADAAADVEQVVNLLNKLPERTRDMIKWRFGVGGCPTLTLDEIAELYDLHPKWVGEIIRDGLRQLRGDDGTDADE